MSSFFHSNLDRLLQTIPLYWRNVWNSSYISSIALLGSLFLCPLAGYAFALLEFRYRKQLFGAALVTMLFPPLLSLIPTVLLMGQLGWIDQTRALWVAALANVVGIFIMRQYIRSSVLKLVKDPPLPKPAPKTTAMTARCLSVKAKMPEENRENAATKRMHTYSPIWI